MRWLAAVTGSVIVLFVGTVWVANHFPQDHAREFYIAKAVAGFFAVTMTVVHMDRTWDTLASAAQRSRYIALLFGTVVAASGSIEQLKDLATVETRNVGGMEFLLGVCIAMVWSLREDHRQRHMEAPVPAEHRAPVSQPHLGGRSRQIG